MPFTFRLGASRNRPIAPSVQISDDGQVQIELKRYLPKRGPAVNFFETPLYEGIEAQYERLGLSEVPSNATTSRTWQGDYTPAIRRYLTTLTRGKPPLPPVTAKETPHARKLPSETNPPELAGELPPGDSGSGGFGDLFTSQNKRTGKGHPNETGRDHEREQSANPGSGAGAGGRGSPSRDASRPAQDS